MKTFFQKTIILSFFLALLPALALAQPGIPHKFYGNVTFESGAAPDGLLVEAKINGVIVGSSLTAGGKYGYNPSLLFVSDEHSDNDGKTITFYVAGVDTGETAVFSTGASTNLNLTVPGVIGNITKTEGQTVTNETVAVTPQVSTNINMGSSNLSVTISSTSTTSAVIEKIEKLVSGNVAVYSGKNFLNAYDIKITGSSLTIDVTMKYSDSGINEDTIAPYRFINNVWTAITPFTIDKSANTITFTITSGQTFYGVFGAVQTQTVTPTPTPSGGTGGATPAPAVVVIKGDIDGNSKVNIFDFNTLMVNWGNNPLNIAADLDSNGRVDIFDFNLLMVNWTG